MTLKRPSRKNKKEKGDWRRNATIEDGEGTKGQIIEKRIFIARTHNDRGNVHSNTNNNSPEFR